MIKKRQVFLYFVNTKKKKILEINKNVKPIINH